MIPLAKQRLNLSEFLFVDVTLTAHFFEILSYQFIELLGFGVGIAQLCQVVHSDRAYD